MGWDNIHLVSLERTKLGSHLIGQREGPADSQEKAENSRDASTSTSDPRPSIQAKGKGVATWSIRDERRKVEWNWKRSPPWQAMMRGQFTKEE